MGPSGQTRLGADSFVGKLSVAKALERSHRNPPLASPLYVRDAQAPVLAREGLLVFARRLSETDGILTPLASPALVDGPRTPALHGRRT